MNQMDAGFVINAYQMEINRLQHENVMLKAKLLELENEIKKEKQEDVKEPTK